MAFWFGTTIKGGSSAGITRAGQSFGGSEVEWIRRKVIGAPGGGYMIPRSAQFVPLGQLGDITKYLQESKGFWYSRAGGAITGFALGAGIGFGASAVGWSIGGGWGILAGIGTGIAVKETVKGIYWKKGIGNDPLDQALNWGMLVGGALWGYANWDALKKSDLGKAGNGTVGSMFSKPHSIP